MIDDGFLPDAHQSPLERPSLAQRIAAVALDFLRRHGPRLADEPSAQFPLVDLDAQRRSHYPETGGGLGEGEHLGNEDGLHRVDLRESRGQEPDALAVALGGGVRKSGFGGGLDAVVQVQRSGLHVRRHRVPLASVGSENLHGIAYVVKRLSHVLPFLVILVASLVGAPRGAGHVMPAVGEPDTARVRLGPNQPASGNPDRLPGASLPGAPLPRLAAALPSAGAPASVPATEHGEVGTALVGGYATWYETPGYTAAAGPLLREMLGADWRGSVVIVEGPGRLSVRVALTDACACGERHGLPTLLDLSRTAFAELADPSTGIVAVSIEIPAQLPSTDTQP